MAYGANYVGKEPANTCPILDKIIDASQESVRAAEQAIEDQRWVDDWCEEVRSINSELRSQRADALEMIEKKDEEIDELNERIRELEARIDELEARE